MSKNKISTTNLVALVLSCAALIVSIVVLYNICKQNTIQESDIVSWGGIVFSVAGVVFTTYFLIFAYRARTIQDEAHKAKMDANETFERIEKEIKAVRESAAATELKLNDVRNNSDSVTEKANESLTVYNSILNQLATMVSNPDLQLSIYLCKSRIDCLSIDSSIEKRRIAIATIGHIWRNNYEKHYIDDDIVLIKNTGEKYNLKADVESAVKALEKQKEV